MEKNRGEENSKREEDHQPQPAPRRLAAAVSHQEHPTPPPKKCPRCDSNNTKFCYYNNYSLSQPRYFCKSCRRYWTHGGALRNVPVGGGCRKSRRSKPSHTSGGEIPRTGSSSGPAISAHNSTGTFSGQAIGPLAPVIPSMGSFYSGGPYFSSIAAMQSFMQQPVVGANQPSAVHSAGSSRFGGGGPAGGCGNAALLQGIHLSSLNSRQFNAQSEFNYRSQQSLINPSNPVINSWAQSVINNRAASLSPVGPSFWGGGVAGDIASAGGDQTAGSASMNVNKWPENDLPGYDPSQ